MHCFIEWLKAMTIEMDWKQFVPSLIATFVGIFVPLWIQSRHENRQRRQDAILKIQQIAKELEKVKTDIAKITPTSLNIYPAKIPIGESILNSNEMQLLSDLRRYQLKKNKKNKLQSVGANDWYELIFKLYSDLSEYNHWWNLYTERFVSLCSREKEKWINGVSAVEVNNFINSNFDLSLIKNSLEGMKKDLCADKNNERSIDHLLALLDNIIHCKLYRQGEHYERGNSNSNK